MTARRGIALGAFSLLLVLFLIRNSPGELGRRLRYLNHYASQDLPARRLGGSSAAFGRRFFIFLESARRKMPRGVSGVALYVPHATEQKLYLASYHLAPLPVLPALQQLPPGWIAAVYGQNLPPGALLVARVSGGALLKPPQ
ncbi:MAG TPA: hypothetical protein VLO07_05170 [Thermoanaerobaculia bacterium]|nr:hypothetical protein [Thermoanaerobaculia bacterium]